jgi:hypothetical protein
MPSGRGQGRDDRGRLRAAAWSAGREAKEEEGRGADVTRTASRERLCASCGKEDYHVFIGALARFEEFFGAAWGPRPARAEECTPDQLAWREVWERCRTEVLNNGNNQNRAVEATSWPSTR